MTRKRTGICAAALLCVGCMSLDPFLFNGDERTAYEFDAYAGYRECTDYIGKAGPIADSLVHQLVIASGDGEVAAVFVHTDAVCDSSDTCILYLHGRSAHIDMYWPRIRLAYDAAEGRYRGDMASLPGNRELVRTAAGA